MSDFSKDKAAATPPDARPGTLRLGSFNFPGEAADAVRQNFEELRRAALQAQGPQAFDDPKSSAVVHEAGHAVLYAYYGWEMCFVEVWECKKSIEPGHWAGKAQPVEIFLPATESERAPEEDFKNACILMAGCLAEALFDSENFRLGSSLDERICAGFLSSNISLKTGVDLGQINTAIYGVTCSVLKKNERVVRDIASILDRDGVIRREALSAILAKVELPA
jgi:hypothetical protein